MDKVQKLIDEKKLKHDFVRHVVVFENYSKEQVIDDLSNFIIKYVSSEKVNDKTDRHYYVGYSHLGALLDRKLKELKNNDEVTCYSWHYY